MRELKELLRQVFSDRDLTPEQVPALDLYMDQVLTLFNDGLQDSKRHPEDKLLTKTMINNYSKEKLLSPIKGKKYSHQHIMQMLCVYQLKQTLALGDVKQLTGREDIDFEACWRQFLNTKDQIRSFIPEQLRENLSADLNDPSERLALCLALSAAATYMRRLCETIIDEAAESSEA
ncbi:MAG: DUF1836 domain-containing protein [Butyricicoccus sp.]